MEQELPELPAIDDLQKLLRFETEEERMVLLRSSQMQALRKEMIESLGIDRTKGLLIRTGYVAGQRDAETARRLRPEAPLFDVFSVGPQSHMMTGQAKVTPIILELDEEKHTFHGAFKWQNSFEAETFLSEYGASSQPVCWMQIGYASGFTSSFVGREILFRELGCIGCGEKACRIEGRPAEEWDDAEELIRYYRPDRIADQLLPHLQDTHDEGEADGDHPRSLSELVDELLERECSLADLEEQMITRAMSKSNGNVTRAARLLGISRPTLDYRLKKPLSSDGSGKLTQPD
ncbi:MAG: XylR N-terminal domain-containing protein [Lewinella sp.]